MRGLKKTYGRMPCLPQTLCEQHYSLKVNLQPFTEWQLKAVITFRHMQCCMQNFVMVEKGTHLLYRANNIL